MNEGREGTSSFCFHFPPNCSFFLSFFLPPFERGHSLLAGCLSGCCCVLGQAAAGAGGRGRGRPSPLLKADNIDSVTSLPKCEDACSRFSARLSLLLHLRLLPSLDPCFSGRPRVSFGISARNMIFQPKGPLSAERRNFGSLNSTTMRGFSAEIGYFSTKIFWFFSFGLSAGI